MVECWNEGYPIEMSRRKQARGHATCETHSFYSALMADLGVKQKQRTVAYSFKSVYHPGL